MPGTAFFLGLLSCVCFCFWQQRDDLGQVKGAGPLDRDQQLDTSKTNRGWTNVNNLTAWKMVLNRRFLLSSRPGFAAHVLQFVR